MLQEEPVSIRSRRSGREKAAGSDSRDAESTVSIRSRRSGREKGRPLIDQQPGMDVFQSAPGVRAGRKTLPENASRNWVQFQSAPGVRAGRKPRRPLVARVDRAVSIRSRRSGREKGTVDGRGAAAAGRFNPLPAFGPGESRIIRRSPAAVLFQSAPGVRAGRKMPSREPVAPERPFQSAPGVRAGRKRRPLRFLGPAPFVSIRSRRSGREKATATTAATRPTAVSIRSRRSGREKGGAAGRAGREIHQVSIRSRRSGREKASPLAQTSRTSCFNPLPAFGPGESRGPGGSSGGRAAVSIRSRRSGREKEAGRGGAYRIGRFNPLPAFGPGESRPDGDRGRVPRVSIRSRRSGREKDPLAACRLALSSVSIRSRRSGREKGCCRNCPVRHSRFQSAPGVRAGRKERKDVLHGSTQQFQSAPGVRAGRKSVHHEVVVGGVYGVSIRSRRSGREKGRTCASCDRPSLFQSAPGVRAGRKG